MEKTELGSLNKNIILVQVSKGTRCARGNKRHCVADIQFSLWQLNLILFVQSSIVDSGYVSDYNCRIFTFSNVAC